MMALAINCLLVQVEGQKIVNTLSIDLSILCQYLVLVILRKKYRLLCQPKPIEFMNMKLKSLIPVFALFCLFSCAQDKAVQPVPVDVNKILKDAEMTLHKANNSRLNSSNKSFNLVSGYPRTISGYKWYAYVATTSAFGHFGSSVSIPSGKLVHVGAKMTSNDSDLAVIFDVNGNTIHSSDSMNQGVNYSLHNITPINGKVKFTSLGLSGYGAPAKIIVTYGYKL